MANEGFELGTRLGLATAGPSYGAELLSIRAQQGRLAELIDLVTQGVEDFETLSGWNASLADLYCALGRYDEAAPIFDQAVITGFADHPFDVTWLLVMGLWAQCAADLDRFEPATVLTELLAPMPTASSTPAPTPPAPSPARPSRRHDR